MTGLTRETLIEAAADKICMAQVEECLARSEHQAQASNVLDAVLTLVADAIEAEKGAGSEFRDVVIQRCADLVRTLGVDGD